MSKRTVVIPACEEHEGWSAMVVTLPWVCLHCGGPRGEPYETISYDGSRRLPVSGWANPCGHIEKYSEVRAAIKREIPVTTPTIERGCLVFRTSKEDSRKIAKANWDAIYRIAGQLAKKREGR